MSESWSVLSAPGNQAAPENGVRIAAAQMDVRIGEPEVNATVCRDALSVAVKEGASLVVYPECALTGYCFSSLEAAREAGARARG